MLEDILQVAQWRLSAVPHLVCGKIDKMRRAFNIDTAHMIVSSILNEPLVLSTCDSAEKNGFLSKFELL